MSKLDMRHPDDGLLLRYLDGELPGRKARQVRSHLEACWQCRTELEQLQTTVSDCVRYRKNVLSPGLPPAPQTWKELDFEAVEAELAAQSVVARLARLFSPRRNAPLRWALSGVAALALAFLLVYQLRETPKVEAAVLLKKAVEAAETRPHPARHLHIVTRTRQITRVAGPSLHPVAGEAEIAGLFRAAHYDWDDPLSARAYSEWSRQLKSRHDEVDTSDPNSYSIKTTAQEGELLTATLKLRAADLEPVQGRFEFRNNEWVEMTELVDQQTLPASTVAGTAGGMPRQPGVPPVSVSVSPEPNPPSFLTDELEVFAALHQVGADLGDPIEVSREGRDVLVTGTGVSTRHQEQLHSLLDRMPHVTVRFTDPSLPASNQPAPQPATRDAVGPEKQNYPARLEERLGGRPQFERFSSQVLDWTDSAMSRVYALRRLAQQFPAKTEAAMRPEERRALHNLGREHMSLLSQQVQKIANTVTPVLTGMGATAVPGSPQEAAPWQAASEELYLSARRMETLLATVLGVTPGKNPGEDTSSQLLTALAQFTNGTGHCLRLLSYDDVRQSK